MTHRLQIALVAGLLLGPAAHAGDALAPATDRIREGLRHARAEAGVPELVRRPDLDGIALDRARRIAALPHDRRLALDDPVENALRAAEIEGFRRVVEHVDLWSGRADPGVALLANWQRYDPSWETARSELFDSVGLAAYRASDGWIVFVAVLVEEVVLPKPVDIPELERATMMAVNDKRAEAGLRRLQANAALVEVARAHSEDMARHGYFGHLSLTGFEPADRVSAAGVAFAKVGENIHKNGNVEDPVSFAVRSWLESRGHREIMLAPVYRDTGVGIGVDDDGTIFFTQLFRDQGHGRD